MATVQKISVENQTLLTNALKTYLTSNTASGVKSIVVKNLTGFASSQVLVIGELGNEGTEIYLTNGTTATTFEIGTATATSYPHSSGTPVYLIDYNQIEYSNASTLSGSKTVLATNNVQVDSLNSVYTDTAGSTGYYFTRFYNTITTVFSSYSDGIPVGGYGILTARSIIDNALGMIGKETSEVLSDDYAFQQINNCQMEVLRELKRWSFMQSFDYNLGQVTTGQWKIAVPTDLDDQNTNKSIYNFRIGTSTDLRWVDKEKWDEITEGVAHTTLAVAITSGTTLAYLTNASDFSDAGTFYINGNTYTYSAINRTSNIATITAATTAAAISSDVFSGASSGTPLYWTTYGGYLYFYPILGSTYNQRAAHLDYYKSLTTITNDSDTIVLPDPTIVQYYLAWKFLLKLQSGRDDSSTQAMYNQYLVRREALKRKEVIGRTFRLKPIPNTLDELNQSDGRQIKMGNFPSTFS